MARNFEAAFEIDELVALKVLRFRETHRLGEPPSARVDALLDTYVDPEDLVGQPAELAFGYDGDDPRVFTGVIASVTVVASTSVGPDVGARTFQYAFDVVTPMTIVGMSRSCAIYQDLDVKGVVSAVLADAAPSLKIEWKLSGSYAQRDLCVQYQESECAFVSRLLEEEGIHYFLEAADDGSMSLVICDDSTSAAPIAGDSTLPRRARSSLHDAKDAIFGVTDRRAVVSGKFVLRDYAFEKPTIDMTATAQGKKDEDLEIYDYPGGYFAVDDGKRLAQTRLEEAQAGSATVTIVADCTRVSVGRKLTISESRTADGDWVVTAVSHEYAEGPHGEADYAAHAELLPADVKFRPARVTPRPLICGPQTATVVAPSGAQAEEIHTDEHGRSKVKFHWDLGDATDDKASAWMRVTQLQTSGSMMIPRVGWEVVIDFLEGNPDRPIVAGRLYNGVFMPPYALPEGKSRTSMQTASSPGGGGSNEVRFEDKAGSEEVMIHSQYDTNIAVANNKTKNVGNNETQEVKVDSTTTVGADQAVKISMGYKSSVGGNQSVSVGAARTLEVNAVAGLTVGGDSKTVVGAAQNEQIGNPLEALIALAVAKAAEVAAAKAAGAIAAVQGAVQGKIDQAMGPVQDLAGKADALGGHMSALANGDLSAAGGLLAGAAALPTAGGMAAAMGGGGGGAGAGAAGGGGGGVGGGGGGLAALTAAPGTDASAGSIAAGNMLDSAIGNAIQTAASKTTNALDAAGGVDADGGGGESAANEAGPAGAVDGVDATDRAKGPGHSTFKVGGSHDETVGALKVLATLNGTNLNVAGNMSQNVGAAHVELVLGDFAEAVQSNKTENELGLIVVAKGESEHVGGAKTVMVGGAVIDKVKGNVSIEAGANLTLIGAMHKIDASSSITIKCGASELTIDDSGVTMKSAMITMTGGSIQLPKPTAEAG